MANDNEKEEGHAEHERPFVQLARIEERVGHLMLTMDKVEQLLKDYVTKVEFWPVKALAFGMAGLILSAVIAVLVAGVLRK